MAFPTIQATNTSTQTSATSHTVNLPASIADGDLLIALFHFRNTGNITWPAGWTELFEVNDPTGEEGRYGAAYRDADGTEGASITVTTANAGASSHNTYRISGAEVPATQAPESATATFEEVAPNPPNLTPTGGAKDYLWLAATGYVNGGNTAPTPPTNYGTQLFAQIDPDTHDASARRNLNAASENPGTFTGLDGSEIGVAATIAVHPATGAFEMAADPGTYAVTGASATPAIGEPADAGSYAVTGAPVTPAIGEPADPGAYAVTGAPATVQGALKIDAGPGVYAVSGAAATPAIGEPADAGAYAVSGAPATLQGALSLSADPGAYALTGLDAFFGIGLDAGPGVYIITGLDTFFDIGLDADPGTYVVTGAPAFFAFGLNAAPGVYLITGLDATLQGPAAGAFEMAADPGSYAVVGAAATPAIGIVATSGSYTVVGVDATLSFGRILSLDPGSYVVSGLPATFDFGLNAAPGSYVLTGAEALLITDYVLVADPGVYTVTGAPADLVTIIVLTEFGTATFVDRDLGTQETSDE